MKQSAQCEQCERRFEYEWHGRLHRVCEACKLKVKRTAQRQWQAPVRAEKFAHAKTLDSDKVAWQSDGTGDLRKGIGVLEAIAAMSRMQVATALQVSYEAVRLAEGRGLLKLRRHPELMRLWLHYKAEGGGVPLREDAGEKLLMYQMELARWYELAERLEAAGRVAERAECLKLIEQFHRKLGEILTTDEPR